jgi:RecT family.
MEEKYEVATLPVITQKEIDDFLFASGTKLTEQQKAMFFQMAKAFSLNPFKREIYAIPYGDRFNIITGYEVYLKRAERTGQLDGWEADYKNDPGGDYAFCTIHRKDQKFPITQKVWLSEFMQQNKMWKESQKPCLPR